MEQRIKMRVLQQAAGNHDPRILSGEGVKPASGNDHGSISWSGGEIIFVTEELANNYERSGMAERVIEKKAEPEAAALITSETAAFPPSRVRSRGSRAVAGSEIDHDKQ